MEIIKINNENKLHKHITMIIIFIRNQHYFLVFRINWKNQKTVKQYRYLTIINNILIIIILSLELLI